jgi:hypothetical protein
VPRSQVGRFVCLPPHLISGGGAEMKLDRDALLVDVPVGFLLPERQEVVVSVNREAEGPLSIRLRLIPAEVAALTPADVSSQTTPVPMNRLLRDARAADDAYPAHDYGGGD